MAYKTELKNKAIQAIESGQTREVVAKQFKINPNTLGYWLKKRERTVRLEKKMKITQPEPTQFQDLHPLVLENAKLRNLIVDALLARL